jgi:hypothetical protein
MRSFINCTLHHTLSEIERRLVTDNRAYYALNPILKSQSVYINA